MSSRTAGTAADLPRASWGRNSRSVRPERVIENGAALAARSLRNDFQATARLTCWVVGHDERSGYDALLQAPYDASGIHPIGLAASLPRSWCARGVPVNSVRSDRAREGEAQHAQFCLSSSGSRRCGRAIQVATGAPIHARTLKGQRYGGGDPPRGKCRSCSTPVPRCGQIKGDDAVSVSVARNARSLSGRADNERVGLSGSKGNRYESRALGNTEAVVVADERRACEAACLPEVKERLDSRAETTR